MLASEYIDQLAAKGRYHFSTADAIVAAGANEAAVQKQLRNLKRKGRIASPMRSFHVIVPPEYRHLGCLPAEQFIDPLMQMLGEPYYIALLSAAARYGAAHQQPQSLQVMVKKSRAPIECGAVRAEFTARGDIDEMPVTLAKTARGYVRYATAEVTALELVGYPGAAAGLSNVATVLVELAEAIDKDKLLEAAGQSPVAWSQRLGYLLELAGQTDLASVLAKHVDSHARTFARLRRAETTAGAKRSAKWRLVINADVEADE